MAFLRVRLKADTTGEGATDGCRAHTPVTRVPELLEAEGGM
jgi:hypothetical protein